MFVVLFLNLVPGMENILNIPNVENRPEVTGKLGVFHTESFEDAERYLENHPLGEWGTIVPVRKN
jgi:hypothetical protein